MHAVPSTWSCLIPPSSSKSILQFIFTSLTPLLYFSFWVKTVVCMLSITVLFSLFWNCLLVFLFRLCIPQCVVPCMAHARCWMSRNPVFADENLVYWFHHIPRIQSNSYTKNSYTKQFLNWIQNSYGHWHILGFSLPEYLPINFH